MNPTAANILQKPFIQVALPILIGLMLAAWLQNQRFNDTNQRLERIETKLDNHNERIARLEERTSLVR